MYVQGVSTRKVSAIVEELCGTSVSSAQVSACAAKLDVELSLWRSLPLGATPYVEPVPAVGPADGVRAQKGQENRAQRPKNGVMPEIGWL